MPILQAIIIQLTILSHKTSLVKCFSALFFNFFYLCHFSSKNSPSKPLKKAFFLKPNRQKRHLRCFFSIKRQKAALLCRNFCDKFFKKIEISSCNLKNFVL